MSERVHVGNWKRNPHKAKLGAVNAPAKLIARAGSIDKRKTVRP